MSTDICQSIIDHLNKEIDWVSALNDVLSKEKEMLEKNQLDQLEPISEAKQTLSENLEKSSRARLELMKIDPTKPELSKPALDDLLQSLPAEQAQTVSNLNKALAEQLHICRERNMVNGQVIATNLVTRKTIINNLNPKSQDESLATYDSQGDVSKNARSDGHQEV